MADTVPLPRPKPPEIGGPPVSAAEGETAKPEDEAQKAAEKKKDEPPPLSACFTRLRELAVIKQLPDIKQGGCKAEDVVQLDAVILSDESKVAVEPAPTVRCEMAAAVTDWIREVIAPTVADKLGSPLRAVENFDSFSCRGRNRVIGAMLSEHGKANALDIRSLKLVNGTSAQPTDPNVSKEFRDGLRKSACERFKTVLGPGSDGYHEDHIHVDLAQRRSDYRLCQWDVRQPVHRVAPSPHIVSETTPSPHAAPASHPVSPAAADAKAEAKPRNTRSRGL